MTHYCHYYIRSGIYLSRNVTRFLFFYILDKIKILSFLALGRRLFDFYCEHFFQVSNIGYFYNSTVF